MVVVVVALAVVLGALLLGLVGLGVIAVRSGLRWSGDEPLVDVPRASTSMRERPPLVYRLMLVSLGVCLAGLAGLAVPYGMLTLGGDIDVGGMLGVLVLQEATVTDAGVHLAWLWAFRLTVGVALGGLAAVTVLSPVSLWVMVIRSRRVSP
jgi:hypothetical protein